MATGKMTDDAEIAVASILREADACMRCGHRRDCHVHGELECCRVKADAREAGGPYRCPCKKFRDDSSRPQGVHAIRDFLSEVDRRVGVAIRGLP